MTSLHCRCKHCASCSLRGICLAGARLALPLATCSLLPSFSFHPVSPSRSLFFEGSASSPPNGSFELLPSNDEAESFLLHPLDYNVCVIPEDNLSRSEVVAGCGVGGCSAWIYRRVSFEMKHRLTARVEGKNTCVVSFPTPIYRVNGTVFCRGRGKWFAFLEGEERLFQGTRSASGSSVCQMAAWWP